MDGATPVYNGKYILGVLLELSFHIIPPWLSLWKVDNMQLVSDTTNFVLPSQNTDQLLQIDIKHVFEILIVFL